jgi:hypothetical protein
MLEASGLSLPQMALIGKLEGVGSRGIGAPQTVAKLLEPDQEFSFFRSTDPKSDG